MGAGQAPGPVVRLMRGHGLVRAPMRRATDRFEGWMATVLAVLVVLVVPLAVGVATGVYQRDLARAAAEAAQRSPVSAVLVSDPVARQASSTQRGAPVEAAALVHWQLPDGRQGSARMPVSTGHRAGDRVQVWVDRAGERVAPPRSATEIRTAAWVIGVDLVLAGWLLLAGLWWGVLQILQQINAERWRAEWVRIEPGWSRRSWQ